MKNEKKSNNSFLLLLFYIGKFIFCQKTYLEKLSLYCYICFTVFFTWQVIGNAVTPTPIQIFIGFADAILRSKILDNRLGILTQILITVDYFFYLYISDICLQFREKSILIWAINLIIKSIRKRIEILAKSLFLFSIIVFKIIILSSCYTFYEEKHLLGKIVWFTITGSTYCRIVFQTMYTSKICT